MSELPKFPERHWADETDEFYNASLAAFWESRCRLAVEALNTIADTARNAPDNDFAQSDPVMWRIASYARLIANDLGPLPKEQT